MPRDEVSATAVYHAAALRNEVDSERALGNIYKEGRGVPKNPITAYCWLNRAAGQGDGRAKRLAEALGIKGLPPTQRARSKKAESDLPDLVSVFNFRRGWTSGRWAASGP